MEKSFATLFIGIFDTMPKVLKEKERLNFRKMIAEPSVLKAIKLLSVKYNEDMYKSAYRLMKMGSELFSNKKTPKL